MTAPSTRPHLAIDVQLNPATTPWPRLCDAALAAEDAGFATVWAWDHLSGTTMRGTAMSECFTLLGALAATTTTVGLGSLVANVVNRHPVVLANAATSVDAISGGRFTLGIGAGASPTSPFAAEHVAAGIALAPRLAERHARLAATLDVLDDMWAEPASDRYRGFGRPTGPLPVIVGVNSRPLATLAGARCNGINVRLSHPDVAGLLRAAAEARRGALARAADLGAAARCPSWTTSVWAFWDEALLDPSHATRAQLAGLGVDRLVLVVVEEADPARIGAARLADRAAGL